MAQMKDDLVYELTQQTHAFRTEADWRAYVDARPVWVTEVSCNHEGGDPVDNVGSCQRNAEQYSVNWGDGVIKALDRTDGVERWSWWTTQRSGLEGTNAEGGLASRLCNAEGELMPMGQAWLLGSAADARGGRRPRRRHRSPPPPPMPPDAGVLSRWRWWPRRSRSHPRGRRSAAPSSQARTRRTSSRTSAPTARATSCALRVRPRKVASRHYLPLAAARGAAADAAAAVAAAAVAFAAAADAAAAVARRPDLHGKAPGVWEITITIEANENVVVYYAPRSAGGFLDADDFINYVGPNDDCADDATRAAHPMDGVGAGNDWGGRIVADVNGNLMTIVNMPDGGTTFRACYLKPSPPASGRHRAGLRLEVIIGAWTAAGAVATEVSLSDTRSARQRRAER